MAQRKNNVEFVTDLMEFSDSGPLMQAFIIEALHQYAKSSLTTPAWPENGFRNQDAWNACATEILAKLEARSKS